MKRAAAVAFGVVLVACVPLYLRLGDDQWFFLDEFDFLADRDAGSLDDLLRPHNEHWSTLPILVWRALWQFVGMNSYVPYQLLTIVLHLTAAALLRVVMRRAGVGPWLATVAAGTFAVFGAGRQNVVWAFQIGFTGSLVAGLAHLLLADHDGRVNRRDAAGLAAGVVGLLSSSVAIPMTIAVGVATLLRRGWRVALLHTAPIGALYLAWYLAYGHEAADPDLDPGLAVRFVGTGIGHVFGAIGDLPAVGVLLAVALVTGFGMLLFRPPPGFTRATVAACVGLLVGGVVFFALAGVGRAAVLGVATARTASRYVHLGAAAVLPAVALAAEVLGRRWRVAVPVVMALLLVGIPGNIGAIRASGLDRFTLGNREGFLLVAGSPVLDAVPADLGPFPLLTMYGVTTGWLGDAVADGKVPEAGEVDPFAAASGTVQILFDRSSDAIDVQPCVTLEEPVERMLDRGEAVTFSNGNVVLRPTFDGLESGVLFTGPRSGGTLVSRADGVVLRIAPAREARVQLCG